MLFLAADENILIQSDIAQKKLLRHFILTSFPIFVILCMTYGGSQFADNRFRMG
jgi:hypothetical protein